MLNYNRIVISGGIDVNKRSDSKECSNCNYWYFLNEGFKFHRDVCNGCYDASIMFMNLSNL